jgi:putative SOS response-associated peptidase YedK
MALTDAIFRLVPDFVATAEWARKTYNARGETVTQRLNYNGPWAKGQRCIIPAELIYEPRYDETGKSTRWAIQQAGAIPTRIAGIYEVVTTPDGRQMYSMAMLTVNADEHPFMKQFHAPRDEKRMVVIPDPKDYGTWLTCTADEAHGYLKQWHGPLQQEAAPLPKRAEPSALGDGPRVDTPHTGDLFR